MGSGPHQHAELGRVRREQCLVDDVVEVHIEANHGATIALPGAVASGELSPRQIEGDDEIKITELSTIRLRCERGETVTSGQECRDGFR